jgi:hypothetical protein
MHAVCMNISSSELIGERTLFTTNSFDKTFLSTTISHLHYFRLPHYLIHHRRVARGLSTNTLETRHAFPSLAFADDLARRSRRRVAANPYGWGQ